MKTLSEHNAIKLLDETLIALADDAMRSRVLTWACQKFSVPSLVPPRDDRSKQEPQTNSKKPAKGAMRAKGGAASRLTIIKDLNLKPKGKPSFEDFAKAKQPGSHQEKCLVSVYYLQHELNLDAISTNHVYTCYKAMQWRVPADLPNKLSLTASRHGWLNTTDRAAITFTTIGENHVEHDLPAKKKTGHK